MGDMENGTFPEREKKVSILKRSYSPNYKA